MNKTSKRIESLPLYTTILSFMVIIIHDHIPHYYEPTSCFDYYSHWVLLNIIPAITSIAVPSFFILSGFLFFRNYKFCETFSKYRSRFKSLVIPYLVWNTFGLIMEMLSRIPFFSSMGSVDSNPFDLQNIELGIVFSKYTILWFLFALIVYVYACPVIYFLLKHKYCGLISIILACLMVQNGYLDIKLPGDAYFETSSIIYYMVGSYIGLHFEDFYLHRLNWRMGLFIGLLLITVVLLEAFNDFSRCSIINLTLKSILFWFLYNEVFLGGSHSYLYDFSFFTFVFHFPIVRLTSGLIRYALNRGGLHFLGEELFAYLSVCIITFVVCLGVGVFLKRNFQKTYSFITGGR